MRSINHDHDIADTGHSLCFPDYSGLRDIPLDIHGKADVPSNYLVYSFHRMQVQDSEHHNKVGTPDNCYSHSSYASQGNLRNRLLT
jgi:hypothetical protein